MAKRTQKTSKELQHVGFWATVWWAVSGVYVVLIVWRAANYYVDDATLNWLEAARRAFDTEQILAWLGWIVVVGWVKLLIVWLRALKQANLTLKEGLKDLFMTLR